MARAGARQAATGPRYSAQELHVTEPVAQPAPGKSSRRLGFRSLLALLAPRRFSEPLAQADHAASLSRNVPVRQPPPDEQLQHLDATRQATVARLVLLRRVLLQSFASMASATVVALAFRAFYTGPMLPRVLFAVGSLFCFASATLGRLGWGGQSWKGDTSAERLDQRIFHVLYWIGMCWGTLAMF